MHGVVGGLRGRLCAADIIRELRVVTVVENAQAATARAGAAECCQLVGGALKPMQLRAPLYRAASMDAPFEVKAQNSRTRCRDLRCSGTKKGRGKDCAIFISGCLVHRSHLFAVPLFDARHNL